MFSASLIWWLPAGRAVPLVLAVRWLKASLPVLSPGRRGSAGDAGPCSAPWSPDGSPEDREPGQRASARPHRRLWLSRCQPALPYIVEAGAQGRAAQRVRQNRVTSDDLGSHVVSLPPHSPGQGNSRGQPGLEGREGRCSPSVGAPRGQGQESRQEAGLGNVHCTGFLSTGEEPLILILNCVPLKCMRLYKSSVPWTCNIQHN